MKPKGQHMVPHLVMLELSAIVLIAESGFAVTFCFWISQLIGVMEEHIFPAGQQIAVVFPARAIHFWPRGQQNSGGIPAPHVV